MDCTDGLRSRSGLARDDVLRLPRRSTGGGLNRSGFFLPSSLTLHTSSSSSLSFSSDPADADAADRLILLVNR
eukprot:scaffold295172_cov55-Attheya_sp.AAC.2